MPPFGRMITAMVTPLHPDGSVDYRRAQELAVRLVDQGNEALVVSGTTGESPTLTKDEKLQLFAAVVKAVGSRVPVIAGTGSYNTAESVAFTQAAAETGVQGILLVTPYYNKPPQEGLYQHFCTVAGSTRLPVMLYNVPGRTATNLQPATAARIARDCPNVVALKECVADQVAPVLAEAPAGFAVYSGEDASTLPMLAQGAVGVVSVAGHVATPAIKQMIQAYVEGRGEEAARLHRHLLPLFRGLFRTSNPILVKASLDLMGFPVGGLRLPLVEASAAEREELRELLAAGGYL